MHNEQITEYEYWCLPRLCVFKLDLAMHRTELYNNPYTFTQCTFIQSYCFKSHTSKNNCTYCLIVSSQFLDLYFCRVLTTAWSSQESRTVSR